MPQGKHSEIAEGWSVYTIDIDRYTLMRDITISRLFDNFTLAVCRRHTNNFRCWDRIMLRFLRAKNLKIRSKFFRNLAQLSILSTQNCSRVSRKGKQRTQILFFNSFWVSWLSAAVSSVPNQHYSIIFTNPQRIVKRRNFKII